jgi:putative ABC transport system permease protein
VTRWTGLWLAGLAAMLSHWRRRPGQGLTLVAGLALATALWSGVQAINAEARASYGRASADVAAAALPDVTRAGGVTLTDFARLRLAGWLVSPVIEGETRLGGRPVRVLGIDPLTAPDALVPEALVPGAGALPTEPPLFAAPATAEAVGGVEAPLPEGLVVTDISRAAALLGMGERVSRLVVLPVQPLRQPALGAVDPAYRLRAPQGTADLSRLTDAFHLNLTAFGLLAFAVGLFVVNGTVGLAFEERRPTIRTLRALGMPLGVLAGLLGTELVLVALVGGGIGMALGALVAAVLLPDVAASLSGLYGAAVPGSLTLRPSWWVSGLGMALGGTALAGTSALVALARMPLLAPARPRAWARGSARMARAAALAGLALVAGAGLVLTRTGALVPAFAGLAALMVGAALMLPLLAGAALALGARLSRGTVAAWAWADTRLQLPGLGLALMALLLALAANIGVSTMVGSFRATFLGWLDQRFAAELYVTARDEDEAARLRDWLGARGVPVLPIWEARATVAGQPAEMFGVVDDPTYRESWPMLAALPDPWGRVARGEGAVINEQLARRLDLQPGDPLDLAVGPRVVAGVYSDYGNPLGQVLVDLPAFVAAFPEVPRLRHGLRVAPDRADTLRAAMTAEVGVSAEAIVDQARLKAASRAIFERTFLVTAALNGLTLGVAAFALLTALLTLSALRLPQLAPVWALGLTRRTLAGLELLRAAGLAAVVFVLAIPLGLALGWVLLAVVNVAAFGWRLPMQVFPAEIARLGLWSLLAAVLAAAWPALRMARRKPADLLRVFAQTR